MGLAQKLAARRLSDEAASREIEAATGWKPHRTTIHNVKKGTRGPGSELVIAICKTFPEISPNDVFEPWLGALPAEQQPTLEAAA